VLPSELSPREDRAPLSRPASSLAVSHPPAHLARVAALSPEVSPTPTPRDAVAVFPLELWAPFPRAEARFPVPPDGGRARGPTASSTRFEALIPSRVRSASPGQARARRPLLSWSSAPPETQPKPRTLVTRPAPEGAKPPPPPEGFGRRRTGPRDPARRVRRRTTETVALPPRRQTPLRCEAGWTGSRRPSFSPGLQPRRSPVLPGLRSFQVPGRLPGRERPGCLSWGLLPRRRLAA
jgi:hypothetical protein